MGVFAVAEHGGAREVEGQAVGQRAVGVLRGVGGRGVAVGAWRIAVGPGRIAR